MSKDYSKYFEPSIQAARKRRKSNVEYIDFKLDNKYIGLGNGMTYLLKTYGCQGNLADSEKIAGILESMGFKAGNDEKDSNLI